MRGIILVLLIFTLSVLSDTQESHADTENTDAYVAISNSLDTEDDTTARNGSNDQRTQTNSASWRRRQRQRSRQRQNSRQWATSETTSSLRPTRPPRPTPRRRSRPPRPRQNSRWRHWRRNRRPSRYHTTTEASTASDESNSSHVSTVVGNTDPLGRPLGQSSNSVGRQHSDDDNDDDSNGDSQNLPSVGSNSRITGNSYGLAGSRSPFQDRQMAHRFLSSNVQTRVRHNERMSENRALNALMAESMCEVFNKHFYQNALGGRCL